jgi:hypothetical protein
MLKKKLILIVVLLLLGSCTTTEPTQTAEQGIVEYGVVTFNGEECSVLGPTEVPTGDYNFVLKNLSDYNLRMGVVRLIDGKTFQDVVDFQGEPGRYTPFVPFISFPFYYTSDHKVYTYSLDKAGEHYIGVQDSKKTHLWLCAPFQVIESRSE